MMAKGLRLLRFEFDIEGVQNKYIALTEDTIEDKEAARRFIINKIIKQKGNAENIALNGISDYGMLTFFSPGVVGILEEFFVGKTSIKREEKEPEIQMTTTQKKKPNLEKVKK